MVTLFECHKCLIYPFVDLNSLTDHDNTDQQQGNGLNLLPFGCKSVNNHLLRSLFQVCAVHGLEHPENIIVTTKSLLM